MRAADTKGAPLGYLHTIAKAHRAARRLARKGALREARRQTHVWQEWGLF